MHLVGFYYKNRILIFRISTSDRLFLSFSALQPKKDVLLSILTISTPFVVLPHPSQIVIHNHIAASHSQVGLSSVSFVGSSKSHGFAYWNVLPQCLKLDLQPFSRPTFIVTLTAQCLRTVNWERPRQFNMATKSTVPCVPY